MSPLNWTELGRHRTIVAVTALQIACAVYFAIDVAGELPGMPDGSIHPVIEVTVVLALALGSALGVRQLAQLVERNRYMEDRMRAASGAFLDLLEESFARWALTSSERDVALLSIKGLSVAEIAALRQTRSGTVKAQCAAVYRKAGVSSRAELLSHFIEDLMSGLTLESRPPASSLPQAPRQTLPS